MKLFRDLGSEKADFAVIDSVFPQAMPLGFRNSEINEYLKRVKNFKSYAMPEMDSGSDISGPYSLGTSHDEFKNNLNGYLKIYPENKGRIKYLYPQNKYSMKLAYSFFLAETYVLLSFYEKYRIPFVFVLYPGGKFGLDASDSDNMLRKIFSSKFFQGVIVTQSITRNYLLAKQLCPKEKIHFIYGGFVQFHKEEVRPKKYYKKDKDSFDICFVAAKYSEKGVDKGYDLFVQTAEILSHKYKDVHFHVIGGFDENDIDVSNVKNIKFYGYKKADFLLELYSRMDIFLAPNRPFKLTPGNFDGFPLGIDAGYCGVALFVADELKMNEFYQADKEIVIFPLDSKKIATKIEKFLKTPKELKKLYELSSAGQLTTQQLFDINYQIDKRLELFSKFVKLEISN